VSEDLIAYDIPIRPGVRGRLILPADLTDQEAERLCAIVRAIAMPNLDPHGCDSCQLAPDYMHPATGERCACAAGQGAEREYCRCPWGVWGPA